MLGVDVHHRRRHPFDDRREGQLQLAGEAGTWRSCALAPGTNAANSAMTTAMAETDQRGMKNPD